MDTAERLVRASCVTYDGDAPDVALALSIRRDTPGVATSTLAAAIVAGEIEAVRRFVESDPSAAGDPTGPFGWTPLMYLAYSRMDVGEPVTVQLAELLLDAGADPNAGRFIGGEDVAFTALTGVLGGGERGESAHPHAIAFARLLLQRGAEVADAQALYNLQFDDDDLLLEVLLGFGLARADTDTDGPLRDLLRWAVLHDQRDRVALLARHGVDVIAPLGRRTPIELARRNGHVRLAESLAGLGATEPVLDPVARFVGDALAGEPSAADAPAEVVNAAREARPALLVWAAALGRPAAVRILLGHGFDVDALGRGDVPRPDPWQTALHTAVEHADPESVRVLLDHGADRTIRDARFDATALDWARFFGRGELVALLDG